MSKLKTNTIRHVDGSNDNITLDSSQNVTVEGNLTVDGTSTLTGNVTASGQLKADALRHTGASSDAITLASDGTATAKITNNLSNRNIWINGAATVAQRGSEQTGITSITANPTGGPDRVFAVVANHGTWTIKQGTEGPPGFTNSVEMISTTGDGSVASNAAVRWWQKFEGYDVQRFMKGTSSAKKFALSFWVKSATTGDYAVELLDYHNSNKGITRTYTVNAADTWEYKTIIFPADTSGTFNNDNTAALACEFWLVAGSNYTSGGADAAWHAYSDGKRAGGHTANAGASNNDYVRITGVQLEAGDVATDFEHRSYGDELRRCMRYYWQSLNNTMLFQYGASHKRIELYFPVPMRAKPSYDHTGSDITIDSSSHQSNIFFCAYSASAYDGPGRSYSAVKFNAEL